MKKMMAKAAALLMVLSVVLSLTPFPALAEASASGSVTTIPAADNMPDNEELFAGYLGRQMTRSLDGEVSTFAAAAGSQLDEVNGAIYNQLKTFVKTVADGTVSSTVCILDITPFEKSLKWSTTDWGAVTDEQGKLTQEVQEKVKGKFLDTVDMNKIMSCLMADCPYELYWFNRIDGVRTDYGIRYVSDTISISYINVSLAVADSFRAGGTEYYTVYQSKTTAAAQVVQKAETIVKEQEEKTDEEKLGAYRQAICDRVSYDSLAAEEEKPESGDAWQIVYVFDDDYTTNVVCEGYSKAFQYLCDLTDFEQEITCVSVSGTLAVSGQEPEAHMWNVVTIDGVNYLADVTNSDKGTLGAGGGLFLVQGESSDGGKTHTLTLGETTLTYTYDESQKDLYCEGYLLLGSQSQPHTHTMTKVEAQPSTCQTQGNQAYYYCSGCKENFLDEQGTQKAENVLLPLAAHTPQHHPAVAATQEKAGNIEYWNCSVCGKYFSDQACTQEITQEQTVISPIHKHSYGQEWKHNDTQHWHACDGCQEKGNLADHTWDEGVVTKEPVDGQNGEKTYICTICKATKIETFTHSHSYGDEWEYDDTRHWHECQCGEKQDSADHTWDQGAVTVKATCEKQGERTYRCTVCGQTKTEAIPRTDHDYGDDWEYDGEGHWLECDCGDIHEPGVHTAGSWIVDTKATETKAGSKHKECTVCGYVMEKQSIPATGSHSHTAGTQLYSNGTYHWHKCTSCGAEMQKVKHTYSSDTDDKCNICNYVRIIVTAPTEETTVPTTEATEATQETTEATLETTEPTTEATEGDILFGDDETVETVPQEEESSGGRGALFTLLVIVMILSLAGLIGLGALLIIRKMKDGGFHGFGE